MEKNKKEKLSNEQIRLLWWLHESEQLEEKLSREEVDQINHYVREYGGGNMWEIYYDEDMELTNMELIKVYKDRIFEELSKDKKSFELYDKIQKGFKKGNIIENEVFQKTYKRFYRLGRNFGDKLSERYFELLQEKEKDIEKVLIELAKIPGSNNKFSVWLSFASKLIHTVDNNQPIYDSMVAEALCIRVKYIKDIDKRIKDRLEIYDFLKQRVREILNDQEIAMIVKDFKERLELNISDVKMLDFMLWKLGGIVKNETRKK